MFFNIGYFIKTNLYIDKFEKLISNILLNYRYFKISKKLFIKFYLKILICYITNNKIVKELKCFDEKEIFLFENNNFFIY